MLADAWSFLKRIALKRNRENGQRFVVRLWGNVSSRLVIAIGVAAVAVANGQNTGAPHPVLPKKAPSSSKMERVTGSHWHYSSRVDRMGRKESFAKVSSSNMLNFGFPYSGSQRGTLIVRDSSKSGINVMLQILSGQFVCGVDDCGLSLRFDSDPIQVWSATEPTDHSTTTLFINGEDSFIQLLLKAKRLRVEATFFQEGSQTLDFNVEGLKWQVEDK